MSHMVSGQRCTIVASPEPYQRRPDSGRVVYIASARLQIDAAGTAYDTERPPLTQQMVAASLSQLGSLSNAEKGIEEVEIPAELVEKMKDLLAQRKQLEQQIAQINATIKDAINAHRAQLFPSAYFVQNS